MPARLTGAAREEKAEQAYGLHIRRVPFRQIAETIGVGKNLVGILVNEARARKAEDRRPHERQKAIDTYEWAIGQAMLKYARVPDNSLNVSGLLNAVINAQKAIDDITGVKADTGVGTDTSAAIANFKAGIDAAERVYLQIEDAERQEQKELEA